jgi:hypothetical protein
LTPLQPDTEVIDFTANFVPEGILGPDFTVFETPDFDEETVGVEASNTGVDFGAFLVDFLTGAEDTPISFFSLFESYFCSMSLFTETSKS